MALLIHEQASVIRHMGYPAQGLFQNAPAGGSLAMGNAGYRFFGSYGPLLYKLNQFAPNEESRMVGAAYSAVGFTGLDPIVGDTTTVTISGGGLPTPVSKTITVTSIGPGQQAWTLLTLCAAIAASFASDPIFNSAGFLAIADYGAGIYSAAKVPTPLVSFRAPSGVQTYTMTASSTGQAAVQIFSPPQKLSPYLNFSRAGVNNVIWGFLPILDYLEGAYGGAVQDMAVMQANNVVLRMDELEQRENMYQAYRYKLSRWLMIPLGDDVPMGGDGGSKNYRCGF